jgi:regulator of protease activity HflC (stomatin/prohibitin superfamily)
MNTNSNLNQIKGSFLKSNINLTLILIFVLIILLAWGCPQYRVHEAEMRGRAELARAEGNRKITVLEANARKEAAKADAEADTIRARGVAQSNKIIGNSLAGNELYLYYLWIRALQENDNDVIYIPTEANLPIMEAGRMAQRAKKSLDQNPAPPQADKETNSH